jgi:hypothetical protein
MTYYSSIVKEFLVSKRKDKLISPSKRKVVE